MSTKTNQKIVEGHHRKPYRKRHLSAFIISAFLLSFSLLQLGILQHINRSEPPAAPVALKQKALATNVSSQYGFSFRVNTNVVNAMVGQEDQKGNLQTIPLSEIGNNDKIVSVDLRPSVDDADRTEAAARASIQVDTDKNAFKTTLNNPSSAGKLPADVARDLFPIPTPKGFTVSNVSSAMDTVGGAPALKTTYAYTPQFNGGKSYAIVWSGISQGRPFVVSLIGLLKPDGVPVVFDEFFNSLSIVSDQQVKGASISLSPATVAADAAKLDPKYLSDAVSPAVVKIYHLICGTLTIAGEALTNDTCSGFTGSGFLVTSDGYIATNGHVVVYGAQDALVDILTHDPAAMSAFLKGIGLSPDQIQQVSKTPIVLASIIAKIYDIPDSQLSFVNKKEIALVATGDTPPKLDKLAHSADLEKLAHDTREIKMAKLVGFNYVPKDKLTAIADPTKGFTASDVALLKIDVTHAPTIALTQNKALQNQKVFLVGFPGDADNELTDNTQLGVSVTDGVISSIRQAAGKNGLLYQSDADASHGNSGGPAIDETGKALGLLTYRASGDATGNAAKSYIRDITDFSDLAAKLHVPINSSSDTQRDWQTGLELYADNHYSAALPYFKKVQENYPAQRLVAAYIVNAQAAIDAGKNVRDVPLGLVIAVAVIAAVVAGMSIWLIIRHHGMHQLYNVYKHDLQPRLHPVH